MNAKYKLITSMTGGYMILGGVMFAMIFEVYLKGFDLTIIIISSAAIVLAFICYLYQDEVTFYDDKSLLRKGFKTNIRTVEIPYDKIMSIRRIFLSRGGSFFAIKTDKSIYNGKISYDISDNFKTKDEIDQFLAFLNSKGVVFDKDDET